MALSALGMRYWVAAAFLACSLVAGIGHDAEAQADLVRIEPPMTEDAFAVHMQAVAVRAIKDLEARLPVGEEPITLIVCATMREFTAHAGPYAQPAVAGLAKPEKGLIILKSPALLQESADFEGIVRHEVVHILLERNVNADRLPRWLNEGTAMLLSREHRWASSFRVGRMYLEGRLIAYRELDLYFAQPGDETGFGDAYAQALSMTRFLYARAGEEAFWALLYDLDEAPFAEAFQTHTSLTVLEFVEQWTRSLWKVAVVFWIVSGFSVFQLMAFLTIVAYLRKRRRGKRLMAQWQEEQESGRDYITVHDLEDQEEPGPWEEDDEY